MSFLTTVLLAWSPFVQGYRPIGLCFHTWEILFSDEAKRSWSWTHFIKLKFNSLSLHSYPVVIQSIFNDKHSMRHADGLRTIKQLNVFSMRECWVLSAVEQAGVYLWCVLGPGHCVLGASVVGRTPVEVELLQPVGAWDGPLSQSWGGNVMQHR